MKKYIAPVAKSLFFETEALIATSDPQLQDGLSGFDSQLSNRRGASSVIWGFDDGVVVEDEY